MNPVLDITNLMQVQFSPLPFHSEFIHEEEGRVPLNNLELPENLRSELGSNLMDWFYRFASHAISEFKISLTRTAQPVAQTFAYVIGFDNNSPHRMQFSLKNERDSWVILQYSSFGLKYDNFILNAAGNHQERDPVILKEGETLITVGICLVNEPIWSSKQRWEGQKFGFSHYGHFILWGQSVRSTSIKELCLNLVERAIYPSKNDLLVMMLDRIGLNSQLKPKIITSKSASLLALDFTYLVEFTEGGCVRVCQNELQYLTLFKIKSYLKTPPDIFSFSQGVGGIKTIDPTSITLYHYDEKKELYVVFKIQLTHFEWCQDGKRVKLEDIKHEGIEKRCSQYLTK